MDIADLAVFEAVARGGSMTRAAQELATVQSNVTARIQLLEQELGKPLFYRHSRGVQLTGADGVATFTTIYPGFYAGRALHIHVEVHVAGAPSGTTYKGGHVSHVGQLFFDESVTDQVMEEPAYAGRKITRTLQSSDGIFSHENGARSMLTLTPLASGSVAGGYRATITLGVDPSATPAQPGPGAPRPPRDAGA